MMAVYATRGMNQSKGLTMIRTSYHHDPIIRIKTVHLVEEVRTCFLSYNGIDVLEDEEAWGYLPCLLKDPRNVVRTWCGFDVESWDG